MRSRVVLGFLFIFLLTFAAPGDSTLNESFNSSIYPAWPDGWHRFSFETENTNFWEISHQQPHTSPYCIKCLGSNSVRNNDWIITRMVYPVPGDTIFSFWYEAHNRSVYESLEVWVSFTTPDPAGMTVRLDSFNFNNNSYLERIVNLGDFINAPIYVGIYYPPFNRLGARIDDITGPQYPPLDVSPIAITLPSTNFIVPGSFTPSVIIKNYGSTSPASFSAACTLYNELGIPIYTDQQSVMPFLPNTADLVNFIETPILTQGSYILAVRTQLVGDMQTINDRISRQLIVAQGNENFYDDGIVTQAVYADYSGDGYGVKFTPTSYPRIIQGTEIMLSHYAYPAQPANNIFRIRVIDDDGNQGLPGTILWESSDIYGNRGDWNYIPIDEITISTGNYYLFWIQQENYTQCTGISVDGASNAPNGTQYRFTGGTYSQNGLPNGDLMIRSIESELITDVGVIAITAPIAVVDSGQTIIPQAIVKNFGNLTLSDIPVHFSINGWQDDTIVTNLAPNESTLVLFDAWNAAPRGNLIVQCSTSLAGDTNPLNDQIIDSVFVRILDAQTISIIQPTGVVNQGDTVIPQAAVINNGNTAITFPVRFEISDGYFNDTIITLNLDTQTTINFALWTANTQGTFTTKCSTRLNGDMYPANDMVSDSVFVQYLDIQTVAIISPTGNFYLGDTATPQAIVSNNSNTAQTFQVNFSISDGFSDIQTVNNLLPGDTTLVSFIQWTADSIGTFETKCTTQLAEDMNSFNDKQTGSVFVGFIDVGVSSILAPSAVVDSGQIITPQALVKNFGNVTITNAPVRFTIDTWQNDTIINILNPNESIIVTFADWTANQRGTFTVKCSTELAGDMNNINDKQTGSVFVRVLDVQTISIISPPDFDTLNQGDTLTPQAIVINNGNTSVTFSTRFEISDGYSDDTTITLDAGVQTNIDFALWTATFPGNFATKCTTELLGDMNNNNDIQTGAVFVRFFDVQTVSIIQPAGSINQGDTITPQAIIQNNGNTDVSFPVRFEINDGYSDEIMVNLNAGTQTLVNFTVWTANTAGSFVTKCTTKLTADMNTINDKETGTVFVGFIDVGTSAILAPPAILDSGQTIIPQAIIKNYGNFTLSNIPVRFTISSWQHDTTIISLAPDESTVVNFGPWTANQRGPFALKCSTLLTQDMNTINDAQTGSVFVRVFDVQVISILQPSGTFTLNDTITPQVTIKNIGNTSVTLPVLFEISDGFSDTVTINLNPDEQFTANFSLWTASTLGSFGTKCTTRLANDMNPVNDEQIGLVFVGFNDVGVVSILAPPAIVDSGQTVIPQAIVKNFGSLTETSIPVRFTIGTWQDDTILSNLAPNESIIVSFASWTADQRGNFAVKCSTYLNGDINSSNDRQTGSVFIRVLDVQAFSINQPTGMVNQEDTITPQALIRNNGNTSETFSVRFEINDGYFNNSTITLDAGAQTLVNFALWTANTPGSFVTKCTTQLANDMNQDNDIVNGSVLVQYLDVQTIALISPTGNFYLGDTATPQALVSNNGNTTQTSQVRFSISDGYSDIQTVNNLLPGDTTLISFNQWTADSIGTFETKCTTQLAEDMNSFNDKQTGSVFIGLIDVGVTALIAPPVMVDSGQNLSPQARIKNFGNITTNNIPVRFTIGSWQQDTIISSLNPNESTLVTFSSWIAIPRGISSVKCSTMLAQDNNNNNDRQTRPVFVRVVDVQTISILQPTGSFNPGDTITPQAVIRNNGNTNETFPVYFEITDGYSDNTVITLNQGVQTSVNFALWTANLSGTFTTKCTTKLAEDMVVSNDKQTGSVFVGFTDVGISTILTPPALVDSGQTISPQAMIKNYGTTIATNIPVRFMIGGWQDDTIINSLTPNESTTVTFAQWTANQRGIFSTKCSTYLSEDNNPTNDQQTGSVFVRVLDVQTIAILQPSGSINLSDTVTPQAVIQNKGNTNVTFSIRFDITDGYSDQITINLDPGVQITADFALWTANNAGNFVTKCSTRLVNDMNPSNDKQTGSVFVGFIDVGVTSILAPSAVIDSGQTIVPQAIVKNFCNMTVNNIPVSFSIDTWQSDTVITSLAPSESTIVTFADWTANQRGQWLAKCSTQLANDINQSNDIQTSIVFIQVLDVQPVLIIQPSLADTFDMGDTITPQVLVRNNGNNNVTFPVKFEIEDGYSDTKIITLNQGNQTIIDFDLWTANTLGNLITKCTTELNNDMNLANDKITGSVFVQYLDIQTIAINRPTGIFYLGDTATPQAVVRNNGNTSITFPVRFEIFQQTDYRLEDFRFKDNQPNLSILKSSNLPIATDKLDNYSDDTILTLGPGVQTTVNFALWTADTQGLFITKCTTQLAEDMNPANDQQTDSVFVGFVDVGAISIIAPAQFADSGQPIIPQARIKNFGNIVANYIPVRFTIGNWEGNRVIASLAPNESTVVSFAAWTPSQRGDLAVKCSTRLAGDFNTSNDKLTSSVFVTVLDIAATAIIAPPTSVDSGQVFNPSATVKNLGNVVLNDILVRFTIGNWYHDTLIPNLAPDESTMVSFEEWTALLRGFSVMKCSTRFNSDMNKINDKFQDSIFVRVLDVAATNIIFPVDSVIKDSLLIPRTKTKNYGNTQVNITCYFAILRQSDTLYNEVSSTIINPNQELDITFPNTLLDSIDIYTSLFSTELVNDMHPENNFLIDTFRVYIPIPSAQRVWVRMADIPEAPSGKPPKYGSCMTGLEATGKIYYLKASNTQDFYIYTPDAGLGIWATGETLPKGIKEEGDGRNPKRGASMTAYEPNKSIYILRGKNTVGFWKYQTDSLIPGWQKLANLPFGAKKCRYGSGLTVVNKSGIDYIFTMKGSKTSEFYLYDISNNSWIQVASPTTGMSGRKGYKKGSCLTYDENGFVYVLKGYYGDFFKYSVEGDSWFELCRYNHKVFRNRDGKKKKVKYGSGIVYHNNRISMLKGGNTYEFWEYRIASDTWVQLDESWDIPVGNGKKVKGGGALIKFGDYLYATKGNRTYEFYRHLLFDNAIASLSSQSTQDGLMEKRLGQAKFITLQLMPNPAANLTRLSYSLSKAGPISFKLYNINGAMIKSYTNSNLNRHGSITIDTKLIPAGVYFLKFNSSELSMTRKLIIEK